MKWLNVKKFKPPFFMDTVLVRVEFDNMNSTLFLAWVAENKWKTEDYEDLEEETSGKVTHFCIPDPIEITDNNT